MKISLRTIIYLLLLILFLEVLISIFWLGKRPTRVEIVSSLPLINSEPTRNATLSFRQSQVTVIPNQTITAEIMLQADKKLINAADVYLLFDPNYLTVATLSNKLQFTPGSVFSLYPVVSLDQKKGSIYILGIRDPSQKQLLTTASSFGKIYLVAKKSGQTSVSFKMSPREKESSAIIEAVTNDNILGYVERMKIEITE